MKEINYILESLVEMEQMLEVDPSLKPPKKWWDEKYKEMMKQYNNADRAKNVVGDIWYNQLDDKKRSEIRARENKTYGHPVKEEVSSDKDIDSFNKRVDVFIKKINKFD